MSLFDHLGKYSTMRKEPFRPVALVARQQILAYIDSPSLAVWKAVRDIRLGAGWSLQDWVERIDIDWPGRFPSAILVARALRGASKDMGMIAQTLEVQP